MGEKIIEVCIDNYCTILFWDECKEIVKAMYMTACIMENVSTDSKKAKEWLQRIFNCFDDWYDRNEFEKEVKGYLKF